MKVALTVALIAIMVVGIAVFADNSAVNTNGDWHESHHTNSMMSMGNMMNGDLEEMHEQCESSMTEEAHEQCETMMESNGCPMMQ